MRRTSAMLNACTPSSRQRRPRRWSIQGEIFVSSWLSDFVVGETCCYQSLAGVLPGSSMSGTTMARRRCILQQGRAGLDACRCCWRTAPLCQL
uniref:Uncharacterized protein n=1 Tax=Arundo donax TaxID=35708 RepID=A0A0A9EZW3_ARUDO